MLKGKGMDVVLLNGMDVTGGRHCLWSVAASCRSCIRRSSCCLHQEGWKQESLAAVEQPLIQCIA